MNRLSILLAIVFVSYSLGAPENITKSQSGDQNLGLVNDSDPELEEYIIKRHGGNVNDGTSTSDSSELGNPPDVLITTGICAVPCASGAETNTCLACISKNIKNQYRQGKYGEGGVNGDPSTTNSSQIDEFKNSVFTHNKPLTHAIIAKQADVTKNIKISVPNTRSKTGVDSIIPIINQNENTDKLNDEPNGETHGDQKCKIFCKVACRSGMETSACLICMSRCLKQN